MFFFQKRYEFWPNWVFETPYWIYLIGKTLLSGISVRDLMKADWAIDHGDIGIGSKYEVQQLFAEEYFPATILLSKKDSDEEKIEALRSFAAVHSFPVILKPDFGLKGLGVVKLSCDEDILSCVPLLFSDYLCQAFVVGKEYSLFYIERGGLPSLTGITGKNKPMVIGDGVSSLKELALAHPRFSEHWHSFLHYHDLDLVLAEGEKKQLSFIGSHTLGSEFIDASFLITEELKKSVYAMCQPVDGFSYGRMDVLAKDDEALKQGDFLAVEMNGITAQPTFLFDPKYSVWQAWKIWFTHVSELVAIAKEHRDVEQKTLPLKEIIRLEKEIDQSVRKQHEALMKKF